MLCIVSIDKLSYCSILVPLLWQQATLFPLIKLDNSSLLKLITKLDKVIKYFLGQIFARPFVGKKKRSLRRVKPLG